MDNLVEKKVAIIGLGYVGLPLAIEFSKKRPVMGFDTNQMRIEDLKRHIDKTLEVTSDELKNASLLYFTSNINDIKTCDIFIITVPTPIDDYKNPNFEFLNLATQMIGEILKPQDIVIYESTVYPGALEEICVPILEKYSNLSFNKDFFVGYSPERVNPGDKTKKLSHIKKITSGSTAETALMVDNLYKEIILAGTHLVSSIKVAEAAKVIENTQRDLNIALINEFAIIFNKLEIDTEEILKAAETKWNFISFRPGLVGGHCIGVDPYYLTHKSQAIGYEPEVILAGRRLNDQMSHYVVTQLLKGMLKNNISLKQGHILIMGYTFKENCPDIRNTKIFDIVSELQEMHMNVDIYDPWVNKDDRENLKNMNFIEYPKHNQYDAILIAINHQEFKLMQAKEIHSFGKEKHFLYDLKYILTADESDLRL